LKEPFGNVGVTQDLRHNSIELTPPPRDAENADQDVERRRSGPPSRSSAHSPSSSSFSTSGDALFRNLKDAKIFAMDIGGSLAKVAYYSTVTSK